MRAKEPHFEPYPEMQKPARWQEQEPERQSDDKELLGVVCGDGVYRVMGTVEYDQYLRGVK